MSSTLKQAIQALKARVADAFAAIEAKGGTLPETQDSANLPAAIASIPSGGGIMEVGTFTLSPYSSDHDLSNLYIDFLSYPLFYGYTTYPSVINIVGVTGKLSGAANIFNNDRIKKVWFKDCEIYATDYIRGTGIISYDLTGLRVVSSASGSWREFLNNNNYAYTTLIGDHTLQEVENGDVVALEGNFISLTINKAVGRASILAIIKGSKDMTGETAPTLKINAQDMAALTADDIAIATGKNWTIA